MAFWEQFPYTNFHEMNQSWILGEFKKLSERVENYVAVNKVSYVGIWDIRNQYPQWAVVTTDNSAYLASTPVPSGIAIDNEDYWIHLADLDPRISGIIARLGEIDDSISRIDADIEHISNDLYENDAIWLFIGDSYDEYSEWVGQTIDYLGLPADKAYNLSVPGHSFSNGSWLDDISNWAEMNMDKIERVKYIVCGGGINDSTQNAYQYTNEAIMAFMDFVKSTYTNAKVFLSYFGWVLEDVRHDELIWDTPYRQAAYTVWTQCGARGACYIWGNEMATHDRNNMVDVVHPNRAAGTRIACGLASFFLGGCATQSFAYETPFLIQSGSTYGYLYERVQNNMVEFSIRDAGYSDINLTITPYWSVLSTTKANCFNSVPPKECTICGNTTSGFTNLRCLIKYEQGVWYIKTNTLASPTSWEEATFTKIFNLSLDGTLEGVVN